jgi:hypothetical protein
MNKTTYLLALTLLLAGIWPGAKVAVASPGSSEEISMLLADVKAEAIALERDAEDLAVWTRAKQMAWQSHAEKLNLIREHVNEAGQLLTKLTEARGAASPWQQEAIDRIYPLLKELADNTETTITHFKDGKDRIHFPPYTDFARANYDLAQDLAALVSDYVEFGEHETEFRRLQEKLQPAAS